MAVRSSWKGYLKLSLVSVPVKGYTATKSSATVRLNQLHAECHNRIKYQKTCPVHGEVSSDEIVSGYEYAKGQYVVIEPDEIDRLRTERERAITIDAIVPPTAIDPVYFTDKTYYLLPDGAVGLKPFALIQECLAQDKMHAVARGVLFGREEVVLLRPVEGLIALTALKYDAEINHVDVVAEEHVAPSLGKDELALTKTLLKAFVKKKFSLAGYKDDYVSKLKELVEAKVEGREIVTPPAAEEPQVINLMDALKRSVAQAQGGDGQAPKRRKMAPSTKRAKTSARPKRKSG